MEPGVKEYLRRILMTLSVGLFWMASNTTVGIMYGYAFIESKVKLGNVLFYLWFATSLTLFLWYEYRLWTKPISNGDEDNVQ